MRVEKKRGLYEAVTPSSQPPDRFIDEAEARRLIEAGEAHGFNRGRSIRLNPSRPSRAALTAADAEALAGARHLSERRRERLAGHGLDPFTGSGGTSNDSPVAGRGH